MAPMRRPSISIGTPPPQVINRPAAGRAVLHGGDRVSITSPHFDVGMPKLMAV